MSRYDVDTSLRDAEIVRGWAVRPDERTAPIGGTRWRAGFVGAANY